MQSRTNTLRPFSIGDGGIEKISLRLERPSLQLPNLLGVGSCKVSVLTTPAAKLRVPAGHLHTTWKCEAATHNLSGLAGLKSWYC